MKKGIAVRRRGPKNNHLEKVYEPSAYQATFHIWTMKKRVHLKKSQKVKKEQSFAKK